MVLGRKRVCLTNNDFTKVKKSFQSSTMKFNGTLEILAEVSDLNNLIRRNFKSLQPGGISNNHSLHGH